MDVDRRMGGHYRGGMPVKWVSRNEAIDHTVVGQWPEDKAREFEDELTGIPVYELGYQTTRGGRHTNVGLKKTPPQVPTDPIPELVDALATTNHDELAKVDDRLAGNAGSHSA